MRNWEEPEFKASDGRYRAKTVKKAAIEQLYRIRTLGLDTDKSAEQILDEILYGD